MFLPRRLAKYVKDATALSGAEVEAAWRAERIELLAHDGAVPTQGLRSLVFEEDVVLLDGQALRLDPPHVQPGFGATAERAAAATREHYYAVLNKPAGVISTTKDPKETEHLGPWLSQMPKGTFPVGRLDRETTGLLLFTTDGDLADAVLRPEHHTPKVYWLWLDEHIAPDDPRLQAVLRQDDPRYDGAVAVSIIHADEHSTQLHLTLDRGKHHQIRRMCRALKLRLLHLHRKRLGSLALGSQPLGALRRLEQSEVSALWASTAGAQRASARKLSTLTRIAQQLREQGEPHHRLEAWLTRALGA